MNINQASILIVDDSRTNRIFLKSIFKMLVFQNIKHASDGEEGLEMIEKSPPDLIILDIVMQKLDGFEVCRKNKIKSDYTKMILLLWLQV
ncbi:response regulator [Anaerobacillus sp. HL2]|nr:response regulator [Anaerobacillus sp. HL2]